VRVEIARRTDLAFAGYEKLVGRVYFAVDPADSRNAIVADLDRAPRNAQGRVEFSADFELVRPKTGGNGVVLVDVVNRGRRTVIPNFNRIGGRDPDVGDGFLMRRGFAIAAVGWEFDLPDDPDLIRIQVPVATDAGQPITGIVRATFVPERRGTSFAVGDVAVYPPIDPGGADSELTVRDTVAGRGEVIARERWSILGSIVTLHDGFEPGRVYEVAFRAANPPVGGLGFAAVRDFATWLKHEVTVVPRVRYAYAFGNSQSGRYLRTFLYQGFNADERGRLVVDGVLANIAGAARLDLNRRWATPVTASAPATQFPFADRAMIDEVSGSRDGLLENPRADRWQPKVFYTNTPVEYWSGSGRAAALTHVTPDGRRDIAFPDNVRSYLLTGAQHSPGAFPPTVGAGQQPGNPLDYWWVLRALLVAMDGWVRDDKTPPASQYPRLEGGTLVNAAQVSFPAIPGVQSPRSLRPAQRTFNTLAAAGYGAGTPLPLLVPQVDADGNDLAGIRLPDVSVPLATFTGWNFRRFELGGTHLLVNLVGSYLPFPRTAAERQLLGDPRRSVGERYRSLAVYLSRVRQATASLVRGRYLLAEDADAVLQRAEAHWTLREPARLSTASR
jgi:hypothetical protein